MQASNNSHSVFMGYLLWIFGFTGAHRFYYGKTLTGILWFCTLGLLGFGWLIDVFLIPSMDKEADNRFLEGEINYSLAWLLLTFFGLFGLHRLYIGRWMSGLLMLIMMLTTISIGAFLPPILFAMPIVALVVLFDFLTLNSQINELQYDH